MSNEVKKQLEIAIEATSENYDPSDDRWIQQINQLYSDLQGEVGSIRKDIIPQKDRKGGIESLIIALGSAGVITAAVDIFRAWLGRDRSRQLKLKAKVGEEVKELVVSGKGISASTIEKFMQEVWTKAGTGK